MSKRKAKKPTGLSPSDALEMADGMGMGEQAAMHVAAEMCGLEYDDFIAALADEADESPATGLES